MIRYDTRNWYCMEGWFPLIYEMISELNPYYEFEDAEIVEIKEKFGGMRIWIHPYLDNGSGKILFKYEEKSYKICEMCGEEGRVRKDLDWKMTLCDLHYEEKINEK